MIDVADYQNLLTDAVRPLAGTVSPVTEVEGLVVAESVIATVSLPGFDNSAMDGYAVRAADVAVAGTTLPVGGVIPAGNTRRSRLQPGTTWKIMTGAPIPEGADAVIQVELTRLEGDSVVFERPATLGGAIRRRGEDVEPGDVVLPTGTALTASRIPVLLSAGVTQVTVHPRPRVGIISTGDELRTATTILEHGQIVDSNGPMLAALARQAGFEVTEVARCGDSGVAVQATVSSMLGRVDAIVTSGGVSAGEFEPLKDAFAGGSAVAFRSVRMQPGKPQGFGFVADGVPLFALPGNPVSSLVSFVMFVAPALRVMAGRSAQIGWRRTPVVQGWRTPDGRAQVARVRFTPNGVIPAGGPGSHLMGGLAAADALAFVPAGMSAVEPGDLLDVVDLGGGF
ncbi:molybdopterin molybdotransferase MoeA [Calidifontibacter terrae]